MDSSPSAQETDTVDVLLDPEMPCNALGSGVCDAESESVDSSDDHMESGKHEVYVL